MESQSTEPSGIVVPEPGRWACIRWATKHSAIFTVADVMIVSVLTVALSAVLLRREELAPGTLGVAMGATAVLILAVVDLGLKLSKAKYELVRLWAQGEIAGVNRRLADAVSLAEDAERELAQARAGKPVLVVESIRSLVVDAGKTMWLVVVRNDGESATFTAKYAIRGEAVELWGSQTEHHATWGTLTVLRPPQTETSIAKGDRGEIRLAETGERHDSGNYPTGTVIRFVRVVGSNKIDLIQPYSHNHIEGLTPKPAPCVVRLSVYATPSMERGPLQQSFVVGLDGIKRLDLDVPMRALLLESRSPHERVREARDWFAEIVLAAKAGDTEAKETVPAAARVFLEISRAYGASGPLFQADYQIVRQAHDDLLMEYRVVPQARPSIAPPA